jgi:hypothetical protein
VGKECVCDLLCLGASFSEKDDDSLLEGVIAYLLVKLSAIIFIYFLSIIQRLRGSMVEHLSSEQKVAGSSPVVSSLLPTILTSFTDGWVLATA